jgi:hypothetical protein
MKRLLNLLLVVFLFSCSTIKDAFNIISISISYIFTDLSGNNEPSTYTGTSSSDKPSIISSSINSSNISTGS